LELLVKIDKTPAAVQPGNMRAFPALDPFQPVVNSFRGFVVSLCQQFYGSGTFIIRSKLQGVPAIYI